jgi:surface antigen
MKHIFSKLSVIALSAILLSACVTGAGQKQGAGMLLGAGIGGLAGSHIGGGDGQLVAVAAGTLAGALLGSEVGSSMDKTDQLYAQRAQQQASSAPVGQTIAWDNPDSGHSGNVQVVRQGTAQSTGQLCREYKTTIYVGGEPETGYGTACYEQDGSWTVMN